MMTKWIKIWINKTGVSDICLGGGVMMNVKAVKKVYEMSEVGSIFVCPSCGDESLPIGGLFYGNQILKQSVKKITNLYLGSQNSDDEIENYLKTVSDRYSFEKLSNEEAAQRAAKLLSEDKVIARCAGREEWGARALGNRSILCNAKHFKNIDILNQYIKDRDFWMPFTPSILKEDIDLYIENPRNINAPYMCITFESTELARKNIPAALHPYDKTIRPQAVDKEWNPQYHALLTEFKKLTGISGILNTSFNLHGEPVVSNFVDVIHTMDNSKLKYALINNFLVEKKDKE
jgi:carbamoyltransferase